MEHYRTGVKVESGQRRKKKSKKDGSNPDSINEYMPSQSCWGVAGGGGGGRNMEPHGSKANSAPKAEARFPQCSPWAKQEVSPRSRLYKLCSSSSSSRTTESSQAANMFPQRPAQN